MGFTIGFQPASIVEKNQMLHFMWTKGNFRPWTHIIKEAGVKPKGPIGSSCNDAEVEKLGRKQIGFYSGAWGWEQAYIYSLVRWMAVKVGLRKRFKVQGPWVEELPHMVVNYESWPVIATSTEREAKKYPKYIRWATYNQHGCYRASNYSLTIFCDEWTTKKSALKKIKTTTNLDELQKIKAELCSPEIKKMLPLIRRELARLDRLWEKQQEPSPVFATALTRGSY